LITGRNSTNHMPAGVFNAHAFQVFNTLSYSIVAGPPMILYFRGLGAGDTVIGIVAALTPLLAILQIPAAHFVDRIGYRRFVVHGWAARSLLVLGMAIVAWLPPQIDGTSRIALMLFLLVGWNAWRGISVCGVLPWWTKLIPEPVRGLFLTRDQLAMGLSMAGTMVLTALFLTGIGPGDESSWRFGTMFALSFIAAITSLYFLGRIPDVPVESIDFSKSVPPWRDMLLYPPFFKILIYNIVVISAMSAAGVFWIPFFQHHLQVGPSDVLLWAALASLVAAVTVVMMGRLVDRVGSRPVLALSGLLFSVHFLGWGAMAAAVYPTNAWTMALQQTTAGLGSAFFNVAMTRIVMGVVPAMGRSHFFALYSVVTSLTMGAFPIVWGVLLDGLVGWSSDWGIWEWNRFSLLYTVLCLTILVSVWMLSWVEEPKAMRTDEFLAELLIKSPGRAITRLLPRRPVS